QLKHRGHASHVGRSSKHDGVGSHHLADDRLKIVFKAVAQEVTTCFHIREAAAAWVQPAGAQIQSFDGNIFGFGSQVQHALQHDPGKRIEKGMIFFSAW
ncbi:MAG: hypothetical protein PVJ77_24515, partial [Desulfobacterales bacterium]